MNDSSSWFLKATLMIIAACLLLLCVRNMSGSSRMELRTLIIVDDAGKKRMEMSVGDKGPALQLFDEKSMPRIELVLQNFVPAAAPALSFMDVDGGRSLTLQLVPGGRAGECSSALVLSGYKGAMASLGAAKFSELRLSEKRGGGASASLLCLPEHGGVLTTFDTNDKMRFNLGTNRDGSVKLEILDADETIAWKAP